MKKVVSFIIVLCMAINIASLNTLAENEETGEVVRISTADDFLYFTKSCVSDAYSKNKQIILCNDIDLDGLDVSSAEIFCGQFDGCGYTIKNIECDYSGNDKALFIRVEKDATIKNLSVVGNIRCKSEESSSTDAKQIIGKIFRNSGVNSDVGDNLCENLGGIVAINEGTISKCSFSGTINGESNVGGIVGYNMNRGMVEDCTNEGEVNGQKNIGGIAGSNDGYIRTSKNSCDINKVANEKSTNIGGIAGSSDGVIDSCENTATIGYENIGNNIGGIAGKQSGLVSETKNSGRVLGASGVGGIIGRFEPFGDITEEKIKENLKNNLSDFSDDINDVTDQIKDLGFDWKDDIKDFAHELLGVDLNGGLGISSIGRDVTRLTDSITDTTKQASESTKQMSDSATKVLDTINGKVKDGSNVSNSVTNMTDRVTSAVDHIDRSTDGMGNDVRDALDTLNKVGGDASTVAKSLDNAITDTLNKIDESQETIDDLVGEVTNLVNDTNDGLNSNSENLDETLRTLSDKLDELDDDVITPLSKNLKSTHSSVNNLIEQLNSSTKGTSDAVIAPLQKIDSLLQRHIDRLEKIDSTVDDLRDKIDSIVGKLPSKSTVSPTASASEVASLFFTKAYAESDTKKSSSKDDKDNKNSIDIELKRIVAGKFVDDALVDYCYNNGNVKGNESVGGIIGICATESKLKQGQNLELPDGEIIPKTDFVKAVVNGCIAEGEINTRDKNTGGIVGFADVGIIKNCLGAVTIDAEDASFIGGIVGKSTGKVENCISVSDFYGKSDIGGIAGDAEYIHTCYSLPQIFKGGERVGAIAGNTGSDIIKNYCIDEGIGGIDGADFEGEAVALPIEDLTALATVPYKMDGFTNEDWMMNANEADFPQIRYIADNNAMTIGSLLRSKSDEYSKTVFDVKFICDDEELKSITVAYGNVIDQNEIPQLPERDGYYGTWNKDTTKKIIRNTTFTAEFKEATTTISSGENPPILLVEGNFVEGTELEVNTLSDDNISFDSYKIKDGYSFEISSGYSGHVRVRVRDEKKKCSEIGVADNSGVRIIDSTRDGSYLVFELDSPGGFYMLKNKSMIFPIIMILLILILIGCIVLVVFMFKKGIINIDKNKIKK